MPVRPVWRLIVKLFAVLLLLAALPLVAEDLSGVWKAEVEVSGNSGAPVFTFKQEGSKITGDYKGMLGESKVTGTVEGNKVRWEFKASFGGDAVPVVYTGTVESPTLIKGKIDFGGQAEGTFVAKREK